MVPNTKKEAPLRGTTMKTICNRLATAFTLAILAIPLLSFALERDSTFYVQYCRAWTSTPTRNDGCIVNTDIQLTSNSVVEIELEVTDSTATTYIFSAGTLYQLASTGTQWQFHYGGNNAAHTAKGGEIVANKRYVVRTSPEGIFVDGTLVAARTLESFTPTSPLTLFSQATSNWNRGHLRFFWMKIYEPDDNGDLQLEHELRPCIIVGAKMGIYDEIGGGVWANGQDNYRALGGPLVVPAPNGVGNVVALTNALTAITRLNSYALECRVLLEPGTYDLAGHAYNAATHLYFRKATSGPANLYLAGMGDSPSDVVLRGGGEADGRRVINISSLTISNLTVTGGYLTSSSYGGGIVTTSAGVGNVIDCIVTNNYAAGANGNGGGGIWGAKLVRNCLIAGNKSNYGGGLRSCATIEDCVISNNVATGYGGGVSGGHAYRCLFVDNKGNYNGGGKTEGSATDCVFLRNACGTVKNYGFGGGLNSAVATNCVFVGNSDSRCEGVYGSAASGSTLVGCTITNSLARRFIFNNSKLIRCRVSNVGSSYNSSIQTFRVFGRYDGSVIYTNVNTLVENVTISNAADRMASASAFVNCTIRNSKGKTNGPLNSDCTAVNTIISGCTPYDVTASTAPTMVNCLYQTSSGTFAEGRLVNCVQGNPRYDLESDVPGAIRRSSPAYNAGLGDAWILDLVGETDFAGNPRVKFDRIDIGAIERQSDLLPGLRLSVQ